MKTCLFKFILARLILEKIPYPRLTSNKGITTAHGAVILKIGLVEAGSSSKIFFLPRNMISDNYFLN